MALTVLLVAEEAAGLGALRVLAESEHRVAAVLTGAVAGRGATAAAEAERLGLAVWEPALVRDEAFAERLRAAQVDLLLNVHSLHVAAGAVVAAPRIGSFNLHPGPLPEYAGLNAPSWAIFNGEQSHAVTLHWMDAEVDAGPIAYEARFPIDDRDTGLTLSARCVREGLPLVERLLADALAGAIPRRPQHPGGRARHGRDAPFAGRLPWTLPARRVADLVRAADFSPLPSPWGHPRATLAGRELEFLRVSLTGETADAPAGTVGAGGRVAAADEWVMVERVRAAGQSAEPAKALPQGLRFDTNGS